MKTSRGAPIQSLYLVPLAVLMVIGFLAPSCGDTYGTGSSGSGGSGAAGGSAGAAGAGGSGTGATGGTSHATGSPGGGGSGGDNNGGSAGTGGSAVAGSAGTGGGSTGGTGGTPTNCSATGMNTFYLSADDSSSMGSPALAREYLNAGIAPPTEIIRSYEFLNYYRVRYTPPTDGLAVRAHLAEAGFERYRLQIGVQAAAVQRPQLSLTLVVDTSGSLVGEGIAREREAIVAIANQLREGDIVSILTWSGEGEEILNGHKAKGPGDPAVIEAADALVPGGGSDLHAGLMRGYELARLDHGDKRLRRVVLISDGAANLGVIDKDLIAMEAEDGDKDGIYMVGVGVGPAQGYADTLMNAVTDAGRGSYVYLDSTTEAGAMLGDRFDEVMDIAARAVRVEMSLPSYLDIEEFYGEGYAKAEFLIEPQHLAPNDSMIFDQVLSLCSNCTVCETDQIQVKVTWQNPFLHSANGSGGVELIEPLSELLEQPWQTLKTRAIVDYANALKSRRGADLEAAVASVNLAREDQTLMMEDKFKAELDEIADLLTKFPASAKAP